MSALIAYRTSCGFLAVATLAISFSLAGFSLPLLAQVIVLAVFVTLVGLPHGALDPFIARKFAFWQTVQGMALFLVAYTGLAIGSLVFWIYFPEGALAAFLFISAIHFSNDWVSLMNQGLARIAGFAVILLPVLFHSHEVIAIFSVLTGNALSPIFIGALDTFTLPIVFGHSFIIIWQAKSRNYLLTIELFALLILAYLLPPLLYFVVYFCGLHSPRHLIASACELKLFRLRKLLYYIAPATVTTVSLAIVAYHWMPASIITEDLIRIVFIGLFALTVPHMLFIEINEHSGA